ncbi:iron chaperone [Nocardioides pocheonensis]|uniref:DUF1801 domain-containing protein n=1 Tax=Nocardioides pocheonensis TaxID=661485 RepID=A0A3N0GSW6_9ACTN|nr:DUF1801 domain-containing protein [Nocardioides pocheonensis]RNM15268.1 DUF1801 domain-containing protein [Nocardioides pocheonensis]
MPDPYAVERAVEHVRALARALVPEAVDGLGYGMPALRYRDRPLLSVMPAKHHIGLYPFSPAVVEAVAGRLDGYSFAKGTIRFTEDHPLTDDLVEDIVRLRRDEIDRAIDGPPTR